jgi:zinc protease
VLVAKNCEALRSRLLADEPSPITYNAPKPAEILEEDKIVAAWKLNLKPENVRIIPVEKIFE